MEVIEEGKHVHEQIIESGWDLDVFVGSSLVDMYAECDNMEDAWTVFTKMPSQNVVTWNALILGHAKCNQRKNALDLFQQMQHEDVRPNSIATS
jgi:pentatricopeptide repeat protein